MHSISGQCVWWTHCSNGDMFYDDDESPVLNHFHSWKWKREEHYLKEMHQKFLTNNFLIPAVKLRIEDNFGNMTLECRRKPCESR